MSRLLTALFGLVMLMAVPAIAGTLEISNPQIRATAPGMKATGGYLAITNHGDAADRLVSASADFASRVEIHEMIQDGDIMRMRERDGGIEIPAGAMASLKPGGLHLMLMGLTETMVPGEMRDLTLNFESGHSVTLPAMVMKPGDIGGHGGHGHNHSHDHDHEHDHNSANQN
ncbi:MAG: copper chaperone PCu(A)C [Candidatus Puniceispirillaceae bacterium]